MTAIPETDRTDPAVTTSGTFVLTIDELPVNLPDGWWPRHIRQCADVVKTARTTGCRKTSARFFERDGSVLDFTADLIAELNEVTGWSAYPTAEITWALSRPMRSVATVEQGARRIAKSSRSETRVPSLFFTPHGHGRRAIYSQEIVDALDEMRPNPRKTLIIDGSKRDDS